MEYKYKIDEVTESLSFQDDPMYEVMFYPVINFKFKGIQDLEIETDDESEIVHITKTELITWVRASKIKIPNEYFFTLNNRRLVYWDAFLEVNDRKLLLDYINTGYFQMSRSGYHFNKN
jgi:hypothetical protein